MIPSLVSVNVTTYNRSGLIGRCLRSVLAQTYEDIQIVVVDDCSSDNTRIVVSEFKDKFPNIKYIRHDKNQGNAGARNTALVNSDGEYIAFLDDDDMWGDRHKLEKQIGAFNDGNNMIISCTGVKRHLSNGKSDIFIPEYPVDLCSHMLSGNGLIYNSTVIMRRLDMIKSGGFDEGLKKGIDSEFFRRCIVVHNAKLIINKAVTADVYETEHGRMTPLITKKSVSNAIQSDLRNLYKYFKYYVVYRRALMSRLASLLRLSIHYFQVK